MPRRIYTYPAELGVAQLNLVSTIGAFLIGVSMLVFVWNLWRSRTKGEPAGDDPWGGATLEWTIPSPPPPHNFDVIPTVASRLPRWTAAQRRATGGEGEGGGKGAHIHVPGGSWWPMITAFGLPVMAVGAISHQLWLVFVGLAALVVGIYRWAYEPFEV